MLLLFFEQLMNIVINLYLNIWWNSSAKPSVSWIFVFCCYMNLFLNSDFLFLQWIHFSSLCLTKEDIFCSKFFNSLVWTHSLILLTYRNLLGMTIFLTFVFIDFNIFSLSFLSSTKLFKSLDLFKENLCISLVLSFLFLLLIYYLKFYFMCSKTYFKLLFTEKLFFSLWSWFPSPNSFWVLTSHFSPIL